MLRACLPPYAVAWFVRVACVVDGRGDHRGWGRGAEVRDGLRRSVENTRTSGVFRFSTEHIESPTHLSKCSSPATKAAGATQQPQRGCARAEDRRESRGKLRNEESVTECVSCLHFSNLGWILVRTRHFTSGKCTRWVVTTSSEQELTREHLTPRRSEETKSLRTSNELGANSRDFR